jgi:hypothetical protein
VPLVGQVTTVGKRLTQPFAGCLRVSGEQASLGFYGLWVPETRCTSRDLLILVEQAAEPVSSSDGAGLDSCALGEWS